MTSEDEGRMRESHGQQMRAAIRRLRQSSPYSRGRVAQTRPSELRVVWSEHKDARVSSVLRTDLRSSARRNKELFHDKSISHDQINKLHELDSDVGAEILHSYESATVTRSPKQHQAAESLFRLS